MSYTRPDEASFKAQFVRDFPYGSTPDTVMDADIALAQSQAELMMNEGLFSTEAQFQLLYNYLAAHYLVTNIKASSQGLNGNFSWLESSKSIGSVSQSFAIPEDILKDPVFAMISKTYYGAYYLSVVIPMTRGQIVGTAGATLP